MRFEFDLRIGDRVIRMIDEAATPAEFFQKMAFWDSLPKAGPDAEAELEFSFRTPQGFEYYAIVCRDAGQEFKFGQLKGEGKKGHLFPKGWEPLMHGADHYEEEEQEEPAPPAAPTRKADAQDELDRLAEKLIDTVRRDGDNYTVLASPSGNARHTVSRDGKANRGVCSCKRFEAMVKFNSDARCEHIRAVKVSAAAKAA